MYGRQSTRHFRSLSRVETWHNMASHVESPARPNQLAEGSTQEIDLRKQILLVTGEECTKEQGDNNVFHDMEQVARAAFSMRRDFVQ